MTLQPVEVPAKRRLRLHNMQFQPRRQTGLATIHPFLHKILQLTFCSTARLIP